MGCIITAMPSPLKLGDFCAPRDGASQTSPIHDCFGSRVGEPDHVSAGNHLYHLFGQGDFKLMVCSVVCSLTDLLSNFFHHFGRAMPQNQTTVPHPEVNVLITIHIKELTALRFISV